MVSVACFGVRVSVMFHLMFFIILLVRFWLLSGDLLGNSCTLGWQLFSLSFVICYIYLSPVLVLRAGSGF